MGPIGAHPMAGSLQEDPNPAIAVPRILPRKLAHRCEGRRIFRDEA
jgi:hypothetical protein